MQGFRVAAVGAALLVSAMPGAQGSGGVAPENPPSRPGRRRPPRLPPSELGAPAATVAPARFGREGERVHVVRSRAKTVTLKLYCSARIDERRHELQRRVERRQHDHGSGRLLRHVGVHERGCDSAFGDRARRTRCRCPRSRRTRRFRVRTRRCHRWSPDQRHRSDDVQGIDASGAIRDRVRRSGPCAERHVDSFDVSADAKVPAYTAQVTRGGRTP